MCGKVWETEAPSELNAFTHQHSPWGESSLSEERGPALPDRYSVRPSGKREGDVISKSAGRCEFQARGYCMLQVTVIECLALVCHVFKMLTVVFVQTKSNNDLFRDAILARVLLQSVLVLFVHLFGCFSRKLATCFTVDDSKR